MKNNKIYNALLILLTMVTFVSSGGGCRSNDYAGGGIGGTGISVGKITAFGSVFVNGVEFDTTGAGITKDGVAGFKQSDLELGMIVTVRGTFDPKGTTGTADSIEFKDNLEGPVDSIDLGTKTLVVLGQDVIVDGSTVFDITGTSLTTLAIGDIVEVSGFVDTNGAIHATYIRVKTDTTEFELKGTISNLNTNAQIFTIGSLTVDFNNAQLEVPGGLSNGLFVEVKTTTAIINGVLIASSVEPEETMPGYREGDKVEIEGYVTSFTSPSDFEVNGQHVQTTSQTIFENGVANNITLNAKLEVKGTVDANGILIAKDISFDISFDISSATGGDGGGGSENEGG